jgi:hypothetical protein
MGRAFAATDPGVAAVIAGGIVMTRDHLAWWGFRLINPDLLDPPRPRHYEYLLVGFVLACILELVWLVIVTFLGGEAGASGTPPIDSSLGIAVAVGIFIIPPLLTILVPLGVWKATPLEGWVILTREHGSVTFWDVLVGLIGVSFVIWAPLATKLSTAQTAAVMGLGATMAGSSLFFVTMLPGILFRKKQRCFQPPDWLKIKGRELDDLGETDEDTVKPEPSADPIYTLRIASESYQVGIVIPEDIIDRMRRLNAENRGSLYQREPQAVILVDREPAFELGKEELIRFCRQLAKAAYIHDLSKLELANIVLYFVQDAITYAFDEDTTGNIVGGPFTEYGRFALETLHDKVGDCECTSILCASLLAYLGYDVALLLVKLHDPDTGETSHHAAVGLKVTSAMLVQLDELDIIEDRNGDKYLYGETAMDGYNRSFGAIPPEWAKYMELAKDGLMPVAAPRV